jgi:hypothetical protein
VLTLGNVSVDRATSYLKRSEYDAKAKRYTATSTPPHYGKSESCTRHIYFIGGLKSVEAYSREIEKAAGILQGLSKPKAKTKRRKRPRFPQK